jgi:two-component system sensor histidine kinase DegS
MAEERAEELSPLEAFLQFARQELEQVETGLKEIELLVAQSQGEVEKLAQRNATITAKLHQIQAQFESLPREDILATYDAAQDAQQRLFTMRGQLEKLQSDQANLERYRDFIARTLELLEGGVRPERRQVVETKGSNVIEQIVTAQEEERRRLSRQIHDGPAQALSNFILQTEIALRLFDVDVERAREELQSLKDAAASTFAQVRDFIFDLRPMMLDDLGLVPTTRRYIEAFKDKTGLDISLVITGSERRLEQHIEVLCFRAIQELLGAIRDHARATQVKISMIVDEGEVRVMFEDNGSGLPELLASENGREELFGSLEERILQAGGDFNVEASGQQGSQVSFSLPIA